MDLSRGFQFKEQTVFDIPKDCRSPNSEVTKRNEKLVRFYGDIAQHRYHRFNLKRGKAARRKLNKSWNKLLTLLEKARTYQDDVRKVNGKAVPIPSHFYKEV
uniref:Uncharacterized protein n=1 Tax=Oryza punctata TaxID=4537 RepID=A0A0E0MH75_ORYPU